MKATTTPILFLWHTSEDGLTSPADTARFAARAMELGVPCELHIYREGGHGSGLCDDTSSAHGEYVNPHNATWAAKRISMSLLVLKFVPYAYTEITGLQKPR